MRSGPRRALFALTLGALVVLAACEGGDDAPATTVTPAPTPVPDVIVIPPGQPLVVGVSAPLSGDQAALGGDISDAAVMAAEEFGTIEGRAVRIERIDDRCADAEAAVAAARELIAEPLLIGVIGPMCTTGAQAANIIYERARTVHVGVATTRVELSAQGERYFFRTAWRQDAQARMQATYAFAAGADTAFVVDDGDPYGRGLAEAFGAAFENIGGRVVTRERIARVETDFAGLVGRIVASEADAVVYEGLNPSGALLAGALRTGGYAGLFIGPDSLLSVEDFIGAAEGAAEQAVITGGTLPDEGYLARFEVRHARRPATAFVLQSHDATTALLTAVRAVVEREADGTLRISRDRLIDELRAQTVAGLTGTIAFDERGDREGESARDLGLRIYRVIGGQFVPID